MAGKVQGPRCPRCLTPLGAQVVPSGPYVFCSVQCRDAFGVLATGAGLEAAPIGEGRGELTFAEACEAKGPVQIKPIGDNGEEFPSPHGAPNLYHIRE